MNLNELAHKMKKKKLGLASKLDDNNQENRRGPKAVKNETREKRGIRKINRNLGMEYITSKEKQIRRRERKSLGACRKGG